MSCTASRLFLKKTTALEGNVVDVVVVDWSSRENEVELEESILRHVHRRDRQLKHVAIEQNIPKTPPIA